MAGGEISKRRNRLPGKRNLVVKNKKNYLREEKTREKGKKEPENMKRTPPPFV